MAALNNDTRLVMTILFVGTVSGANVYFYSAYGLNFPDREPLSKNAKRRTD